MNISTFVQLQLIGAMLAVGATGCKRDPVLGELNRLKEYAIEKGFDVEEQRAELALSKWQNGRLDSEPVLLWAALGKATGMENIKLSFFTFDEDKDIVGSGIRFGIIEEFVDANGLKTILTEEYEATGKGLYPWDEAVRAFILAKVQIRDAGQRKDVQRWNEYLEAKSGGVDAGRDLVPVGGALPVMPPIWISVPEPNHVDVHIYIYDQQGHKSETIRVANLIPQDE